MEVEKKKARHQKTVRATAMTIRYHSFTVPDMDEQANAYGIAANADG